LPGLPRDRSTRARGQPHLRGLRGHRGVLC